MKPIGTWTCPQDVYDYYPNFYNNPFIQHISDQQRWTISDNTKKPIDMYALRYEQKLYGALYPDYRSLETLPTLLELVPNAANHAYSLDALEDGYVVLDIEPKCPDDIKQKFLNMPYVYGEYSMSGKGLHLVFPLPACFDDYPAAKIKTAMREEHGYYEVLLDHYVTFTRNTIDLPANPTDNFEETFKSLCTTQTISNQIDFDLAANEPQGLPYQEEIIGLLSRQTYRKTPDDFHGNMSSYEFGYGSFLYYKLQNILKVQSIMKTGYTYTESDQAWFIYTVLRDYLPPRAKHNEPRNNLPWLLYLARTVVAKHAGQDDNEKH